MYLFLLALIYIAFISLGLPDSLLGSGWPVMHAELGVPVSYMGIISMIISGGFGCWPFLQCPMDWEQVRSTRR